MTVEKESADPGPLPPTVKNLEAKIAALEARLAASDGLEARVIAKLEGQIKALEAKLETAKETDTPKAPARARWSDHFFY